MIEIFVIVALVALLGWDRHENRKERSKMLNAILSKNTEDQVHMDMADKTKIVMEDRKEQMEPDLVQESQLDDREFNKRIKEELGG